MPVVARSKQSSLTLAGGIVRGLVSRSWAVSGITADCQFSEELDDYTGQYRLWPVPGDELADELEAWAIFTAWRDEHDSGLRPGPFPGVRQSAALDRVRRRRQREPSPDARTAIPEWRLDRDHSFAGRVPAHAARWIFVD